MSEDEIFREVRVEELIGRKIRDAAGRKIGRIEEVVAEWQGTDLVVTEVHVGPGALLERVIDLATLIPYSGAFQRQLRHLHRIRWDQLDLSDPDHPTATVRQEELTKG
jgi:sporulation protein YlmC with PRC-barrel domain